MSASRQVLPSSISTVPIMPQRLIGFVENVAEEIGGGGFAVGAGDAEDFEGFAGVVEEGVGELGGGG